MSDLVERIRSAVADDQFVVSLHASERCEEREVTVWQLVLGLDHGKLLESRPNDTPYPSVIVEEMLPGVYERLKRIKIQALDEEYRVALETSPESRTPLQDQQASMQAFMSGQIQVEGDMTKLMSMQAAGPPSEEAKQLQDRIKQMTV